MIHIEKTSLIAFDDVAERARITSVFKGADRVALLGLLDAVVAGDWDVLVSRAQALTRDQQEYMAEPVHEIVSCHMRRAAQARRVQQERAFNFPEERVRIESEFAGEEKEALLGLLDAIVAGDWEVVIQRSLALTGEQRENLGNPFGELVTRMLQQSARTQAAMYARATGGSQLSTTSGTDAGALGARYPRLMLLNQNT